MLRFEAESYDGDPNWVYYEIFDGAEKIACGIRTVRNALATFKSVCDENRDWKKSNA